MTQTITLPTSTTHLLGSDEPTSRNQNSDISGFRQSIGSISRPYKLFKKRTTEGEKLENPKQSGKFKNTLEHISEKIQAKNSDPTQAHTSPPHLSIQEISNNTSLTQVGKYEPRHRVLSPKKEILKKQNAEEEASDPHPLEGGRRHWKPPATETTNLTRNPIPNWYTKEVHQRLKKIAKTCQEQVSRHSLRLLQHKGDRDQVDSDPKAQNHSYHQKQVTLLIEGSSKKPGE